MTPALIDTGTTLAARAGRSRNQRGDSGLRLAYQLADPGELIHHIEAALVSRSSIDQALGIIMGQQQTTRSRLISPPLNRESRARVSDARCSV